MLREEKPLSPAIGAAKTHLIRGHSTPPFSIHLQPAVFQVFTLEHFSSL